MMLRHLLKLTWKRKSRNLMLSLEILLAFAIVFAVAAFALRYWQLYREPMGFDGSETWSVTIHTGEDVAKIPADTYATLRRNLLAMPEVRAVGFSRYAPYTMSNWRLSFKSAQTGADVLTSVLEADDGFAEALGMKVVRGRWFELQDEGAAVQPAVLDKRMAAAAFPGKDPLGQQLTNKEDDVTRTFKVVGVIDTFRNMGPLVAPGKFIITRFAPLSGTSRVNVMMLKVAPGTPRAFEAKLNQQLKLVNNGWSYEIAPLSSMRASLLKEHLVPLAMAGIIAAFMLTMVAFGLFGVLWQNTTRRIPEIGLRRAVGAHAANIYGQIVAEQLLLSTFAMVLGLLLLVQLPLTHALGESLNWLVFTGAALLSMGVIYLLSLLCSLYPGWRASRLSPTEALHYE